MTPVEHSLPGDARQAASGARLGRALSAPLDAASLACFRIAFGAVMLWEMARWWLAGWLETDYLGLKVYFTYYGFDWVRPWPDPGMYVQLAVMTVAAAGLVLGLCSRVSALAFCLGYTHLFLIETTYYQNHCYLICLVALLLAFVPAHRCWSLDAWRRQRRGPPAAAAVIPAWSLWLLRFQIGVPYFYGGLAKLEHDWLHGAQMRMMLSRSAAERPWLADLLTHETSVWVFTWGGLLLDLLIVPALLWRKTRAAAYGLAVLFHLANAMLLEIGIFPWLMIVATLIYFEPDWPRRALRWFGRRRAPAVRPARPAEAAVTHDSRRRHAAASHSRLATGTREARPSVGRWTLALLGVYVGWQVLFPFRPHLYPGNASWTEEGHRFSWRMKLGLKTAMLPQFYATDPATGATRPLVYDGYLTLPQLELMAGHPDKLLQFARFLAGELEQRGYGEVEIRVVTAVSLNGRRPQSLVDPRANLAGQPRNLWPKPWIVPLREPLREQPWDWGMPALGGLETDDGWPQATICDSDVEDEEPDA